MFCSFSSTGTQRVLRRETEFARASWFNFRYGTFVGPLSRRQGKRLATDGGGGGGGGEAYRLAQFRNGVAGLVGRVLQTPRNGRENFRGCVIESFERFLVRIEIFGF